MFEEGLKKESVKRAVIAELFCTVGNYELLKTFKFRQMYVSLYVYCFLIITLYDGFKTLKMSEFWNTLGNFFLEFWRKLSLDLDKFLRLIAI